MSLFDMISPSPQKVMTLFYIIDSSRSMGGEPIRQVNSAMRNAILTDLPRLAYDNDDADIRIAALRFSTETEWIPDIGPISVKHMDSWKDLRAGGWTNLGKALNELNNKLSQKAFMSSVSGSYAPVLFLLSDGGPTDEWESALKNIQLNNWFRNAIKIAIAFGKKAKPEILARFTGDNKSVISVYDPSLLYELIRLISLRSSDFQSKSRSVTDANKSPEECSVEIVKNVVEEIKSKAPSNHSDWDIW